MTYKNHFTKTAQPLTNSKYLCIYPQNSIVLIHHQGIFFLCDRDHYIKLQPIRFQDCGAQSQRIYLKTRLVAKVQEYCRWVGQKDCKGQRIREFAVRLCLLVTPEATPRKSPQHDCPSMSQTKTTKASMPKWMERRPWSHSLYKELKTLRNAESGRNSLPQGRAHQLVIQDQEVHPKDIHSSNII